MRKKKPICTMTDLFGLEFQDEGALFNDVVFSTNFCLYRDERRDSHKRHKTPKQDYLMSESINRPFKR
jgi:hypothetical protein